MKKTLVPVLLTLVAFPATADARARLTQDRADRAAAEEVAFNLENGQAMADPEDAWTTSAELDPCDMLSARRAECLGTFYFSDGDACDFTYEISVSRRGRITGQIELDVCDND